jgi:hypothetical protein
MTYYGVKRQGAQFYANCAHVHIINDDGDVGTPGPTTKIPGVYTLGQKGAKLCLISVYGGQIS